MLGILPSQWELPVWISNRHMFELTMRTKNNNNNKLVIGKTFSRKWFEIMNDGGNEHIGLNKS